MVLAYQLKVLVSSKPASLSKTNTIMIILRITWVEITMKSGHK